METELTRAVQNYQRTGLGLDAITEDIALRIYQYPVKRFGWSEDDTSDFFLTFYEKLPGLVRRFRFSGHPFETFLFSSVKWQMKTFLQKKKRGESEMRILEDEQKANLQHFFQENPTRNRSCSGKENIIHFPGKARQSQKTPGKQLLYLLMKNSFQVAESQIEEAADKIGVSSKWIASCIDELNARLVPRLDRLHLLRERRNRIFFRIKYLEEQIHCCNDDLLREELIRKVSTARTRLKEIQKHMGRIPLSPTHRDIADVLNVPKGSVDSGLHYLKKKHADLYQNGDFRYA